MTRRSDTMTHRTYSIRDVYFWIIVFSLFLASFFILASLYMVQPLMPVFVDVFGVSVSSSSLTLSLTVIGMIIGLTINGYLSDRLGRTIFIKLSLVGAIIPFIVTPIFNSFSVLLVFRLVQGFALAGLPAAALAYIAEEIDRKGMGLATAFYIASNALGGMAGRFVTGYLVDQHSWQMTFYLWAGVGIVILIMILFLLPSSRFFRPIHTPFKKDLRAYAEHLKNPVLLLFFLLGIVLQLSFTGVWTYLPFYLQNEPFYLSLQNISFFYLAYGLGVMGSSVAGILINHFELSRIRTIAICIMTVGIVITFYQTVYAVAIGLCLICLGFFTAHSLTATSVTMTATHHKGSASSLYLASYYIGVTLGSTMFAPVWEKTEWIGLITIASIIPVALMIFQHIFMKKVRMKEQTNSKSIHKHN